MTKLIEVVADVIFFHFVLESTNKQLFHCCTSLWATNFLSWNSSFGLYNSAINTVGPVRLSFIYHRSSSVGNESKATGFFGFGVFHDNNIHNVSPLFVEFLK